MIEHRVVVDVDYWEKAWEHYTSLILDYRASGGIPDREWRERNLQTLKSLCEYRNAQSKDTSLPDRPACKKIEYPDCSCARFRGSGDFCWDCGGRALDNPTAT